MNILLQGKSNQTQIDKIELKKQIKKIETKTEIEKKYLISVRWTPLKTKNLPLKENQIAEIEEKTLVAENAERTMVSSDATQWWTSSNIHCGVFILGNF